MLPCFQRPQPTLVSARRTEPGEMVGCGERNTRGHGFLRLVVVWVRQGRRRRETPAVNWGAAEVSCHTGGAWTSLHPPPASLSQPAVWGGSAVPVSGHGHQHLTLAHLLQGTGQAVEVPVILL